MGLTARRPPFWATILTLTGLSILCALGGWQLQRLHWKESLLAQIETAYQADPTNNRQSAKTLADAAARKENFIRGSVTGHFTNDAPLRSGPRPLTEKPGYHAYALFRMQDGGTILINRGWMPQDATPPAPPAGTQTLTGLFRPADRANTFTPENDPAQNIWFRFDSASIAAHYKRDDVAPYILYLEASGETATPPIPVGQRPEPNNNHRQYALFWFAMAGVLLVIYILRFIATARR